MLKEEYENLSVNDLVARHFTFKDEYNNHIHQRETYIVTSGKKDGYFLVRTYPTLFNEPSNYQEFHYTQVELATTEVHFDLQRSFLYRELGLLDYGKNFNNKTKKNKNKMRLLRIKPLNVRDLFVQFKGINGKQGVIPYCKLPKEIILLDMDPAVFDRAYIRRDGWLAWFIPGIGEYALSPKILYNLL